MRSSIEIWPANFIIFFLLTLSEFPTTRNVPNKYKLDATFFPVH